MYQAGDYIVYGTSGVCRVDEIKPSPFEGEEGRQYYTLTPVTGTETIYIPVDSPVFTRPVISKEKAASLETMHPFSTVNSGNLFSSVVAFNIFLISMLVLNGIIGIWLFG